MFLGQIAFKKKRLALTARLGTILLATILFLFLFSSTLAFAQEAKVSNIIVTNTRDDFIVYLTVEGAFEEKMKKAVLSGVPTKFSFFITLYKSRNMWLDKKIADVKLTHTIKYDSLKNEFIVRRSWKNGKPEKTQSFKEAQKLMTEIDSLKVLPLDQLEKGNRYQLRAKAELNKLTLPFYLHYVLFFVSLWDFETDWYTIDFIY